jgi:ceramide glucosyltransferase
MNNLELINYLIFLLCILACCYYAAVIYLSLKFTHKTRLPVTSQFSPPVTILKPLYGVSKTLYTDLASFCYQDYPLYQIIFVVKDPSDPSIEVVTKLIHNFPQVDISLVCEDYTVGTNPKVSNLYNALTHAKYSLLLLADSDIRVDSNYLKCVVQPLADERVGLITCLYRSFSEKLLGVFEALGSSTQLHPGVLVAQQLQGMYFAFGSTIVIRSQVLEAIGGLKKIADYLADDFQLGHLVAKLGYQVVLSDYVVEHHLETNTIAEFWNRQIRWACCIKAGDPWGYLGLSFTHGTVYSFFWLLINFDSPLGWLVFLVTWSLRLLDAWLVGVHCLRDRTVQKYFWLIPLRDFVHFGVWCYGFMGKTIRWGGKQFQLIQGGKLMNLTERRN